MKISPQSPEMSFNTKSIENIEKLLHDSAYRELIQISANFNTKMRIERKMRAPFLDPQTGVAQRHSNLYMKKTQRIPGLKEGQIYTYPSVRWRNKKNSFLKLSNRPFFRFRANDSNLAASSNSSLNPTSATTTVTSNSNGIALTNDNGQITDFQAIIDESNSLTGGGGADTDSKDSQEVPKDWYYDDMDANDGVSPEEQQDSDFDYNVNGYKRKKKGPVRKSASRKPKDSFGMFGSDSTEKASTSRGKRSGGGGSRSSRKKGTSSSSRSSKSKSEKTLKASPPLMYDEPPSFDSVQGDLKLDGSNDGFPYRKY